MALTQIVINKQRRHTFVRSQ